MTTASPFCGTERYLAWELLLDDEDAVPTTASDIYATGCIGLEASGYLYTDNVPTSLKLLHTGIIPRKTLFPSQHEFASAYDERHGARKASCHPPYQLSRPFGFSLEYSISVLGT
jgi:serine/threonine protein kinase